MEKKITRENLVENYKIALTKLDELKNKKYEYKIACPCQPFGPVKNMSMIECVKAYASVHDGISNFDNALKFLGLTNEDINSEERKYLNCNVTDWDHDFKLRVEELKDKTLKEKYEKVIAVFKKNFSDDDRFTIEMSEVMDLGIEI